MWYELPYTNTVQYVATVLYVIHTYIQQMTLESSFADMQALNVSWFYDCDGFRYVGLKLKFIHAIFTKCLLSQTSDRFAIESHTEVTTMQLLQ